MVSLLLCCLYGTSQAQFDRNWKVYLVPFSHTDVGYTDSVPVVIEQHNRYLDTVITWVNRTSANAEGEQYKWNIEISWPLESYIQTRPQSRVDSLFDLIRQNRIALGAFHFSLQTDLCGNEELVRSLYYSHALSKKYNVPVTTGQIDDTPGFTWGLSELLAKSGIKYFSVGVNSFLANFFTTTSLPYLFYWKSQNGSRTLVWRNIDKQWAYLEGSVTQQVYASYSNMKNKITQLLQQLQTQGYPYDAVFINCATGDNGAPNLSIVQNVHQWNQEFSNAKLRIATTTDFFEYVENKYASQIPEYTGDGPNWWTWLFSPSATGGANVSREAQMLLPQAEAMSSIAKATDASYPYSMSDFQKAYVNNMLFEDHNLGAVNSAGNQDYWNYKMQWINAAHSTGKNNLSAAVQRLSENIPTADLRIAVFNSLLWKRNETAFISRNDALLKGILNFQLVDLSTGETIVPQFLSDTSAAFFAKDIPGLGYKIYKVQPVQTPIPDRVPLTGLHLESDAYSININSGSGDILNIYDKLANREITKQDGVFNRYLFNGNMFPQNMRIISSDSGQVVQRIEIAADAAGSNSYHSIILLHNATKRIDFFNSYDKITPGASSESVDFKFGFGLPGPLFSYEIPFGSMRLFTDELSGFRTGHYTVGRWMNISSSAENVYATLATRNANISAYPSGTFDGTVRMFIQYSSASSAYRAGIGNMQMDFSVTSATGTADKTAAVKFSQNFNMPLITKAIPADQKGTLPEKEYSFASLSSGFCQLSTLKMAEDGRGMILRVFNPDDLVQNATLNFANRIVSAEESTPLEEFISTLGTGEHALSMVMQPHEIRTLRIQIDPAADIRVESKAQTFVLEQNFPNPFNPETKIKFHVPAGLHGEQRQQVKLAVYDLLGRLIKTLVNDERTAGSYEVAFNAAQCASGVYFYELRAGDISRIRKMIVLR